MTFLSAGPKILANILKTQAGSKMPEESVPVERLDSWKAIAGFLGRDIRTVIRWEKEKGLPVHRVPGGQRQGVFAYRGELENWLAGTTGAARTEPSGPINIVGAQIGSPLGNGMTIPFAFNLKPGQNPAAIPPPGEYWLRVYTMDPVFCVQSLTAGGMDLAHEPLHVGLNGAIPPMELVLRDDCAKLTLSLPPALNQLAAGEEQAYTVYVVPAIDSPVSLLPITLRATSGGSVPLSGLTPGPYRVFTFDRSVELEVHNPDALAALPHPGQAVTLQPNGAVDLVVEVPQP